MTDTITINIDGREVNGKSGQTVLEREHSGDAREAPAHGVTRGLLDLGAEVRAADPHVAEESVDSRVKRVDCTAEELEAADAVVLLVDHDVFDPDLITTHARFVFDTRRFLTGERVEHL